MKSTASDPLKSTNNKDLKGIMSNTIMIAKKEKSKNKK